MPLLNEIQMNIQLSYVNGPENHLCVAEKNKVSTKWITEKLLPNNVLGISIGRYL